MSEQNRNNAALTKHSSNGLMRVENAMGITKKILNEISAKGFQFNYRTVEINGITYLAENLRETHFRNGDPIIEAKTDEHWKYCAENKIPAFCHSRNDPAHELYNEKLYNYFCISDPRGLFPTGWEIVDGFPNKKVSNNSLDNIKLIYSKFVSYGDERDLDGSFTGMVINEFVFAFWCYKPQNKFHNGQKCSDIFSTSLTTYDYFVQMNDLPDEKYLGMGLSIRCMKTK